MPRDLASEVTRLLAAGAKSRALATGSLRSLLAQPGAGAGALWQETQRHRLSALIGSRAIELAPEAVPEDFSTAVARAAESNRIRALGIETLAQQAIALLNARNIKALPLKGPFLARRAYGDSSMRTVNDLDLLVPLERLDDSVAAIRELGYVSDDPPWTKKPPDLHYVLRSTSAQLPRIEVHWRIHWYEVVFSRDMLDRSAPDQNGLPIARADDELAALLLYYARDSFYGLRLAADIAAWLDRHGDELPRPALARHWDEYPRLRRALRASARSLAAVVSIPASDLVPNPELAGPRVRVATRLANWRQTGEHDQQVANVALVDGLLAPTQNLWPFLKRYAVLDRLEIASIYGLRADQRLRIALWKVLHPPKVFLRYLLGTLGAIARPAR